MCWLTGLTVVVLCSAMRSVHLDEELPIWFGRAQDANSARFTTDLPNENIVSFSERLVQHSKEHPYDELAALIRRKGWAQTRIGVEMDAHYYTGTLPCPSHRRTS